MSCEYARESYGVPAELGRRIRYRGVREGEIVEDRQQYIGVRFDNEPDHVLSLHPTWEVKYLGMAGNRTETTGDSAND